MAFPSTPLDIDVELRLDGVWTDVTTYVRAEGGGIDIKRGRSSEGSAVDPGTCSITFENTDGRFSPRNPNSPYFGILGRNTPVRVSLYGGTPYLNLPGGAGDRASTPDTAALDITGDIDVRIEASLDDWGVTATTELLGKYNVTGNQRSYRLLLDPDGFPVFSWSTDGTAFIDVTATEPIQGAATGRIALRATLDVNNGLGGYTVTFYTANSIDGGYDQFGGVIETTSGTTSIFSSTADLQVGDIANLSFDELQGKVYAAQVRNGIGGTAVANIDFTLQTVGATSFTGTDGLTWTLAGNASISNKQTRFSGEVSSWPPAWGTGGFDVTTTVEGSGIIRRLGTGQSPLGSCLSRAIAADDDVVAYWPMEDGVGATHFYSPISGVRPMSFNGLTLAAESVTVSGYPAGSSELPTVATAAYLSGRVPSFTSTQWQTEFLFKIDTAPTTLRTILAVRGTGTVKLWRFYLNNTTARVRGEDGDGATLFDDDITGTGNFFGGWRRCRLRAAQNGGNVDWTVSWFTLGGTGLDENSGSYAGTVGRVSNIESAPGNGYSVDLDGMGIGHIAVFDAFTTVYSGPDIGSAGETAGDRMLRLAGEEGVPILVSGTPAANLTVGAQGQKTFLELVQEAAEADQGMLFERRDTLALAYRDKLTLYDQSVHLDLDYEASEIEAPLSPVDDDQNTENDVTVSRDSGSSARVVDTETKLSVNQPPDGVGVYATSYSFNLHNDDNLEQVAGWKLRLGTLDEARFPQVRVNLARNPSLISQVINTEVGDRLRITNPPSWLPPEDINLMVIGYTEQFSQYAWVITYNCVPYTPWAVSNAEEGDYDHVDTAGCETIEALDTTETAIDVLTTADYRWVDSATYSSDFPFDIMIGGERMTVTACTPSMKDDFSTNQTDTWGSADIGGTWTNTGGVAGNFDVAGGVGTHTLTTTTPSRRSYLTALHADFDVYAKIACSAVPTGGSLYGSLMGRYIDGNNLYWARLEFTTGSEINLTIRKLVAAAETQLGSYNTRLTFSAGTYYRLRFQAQGTTLRARMWEAGTAEPTNWQIEVTDSSLTSAGSIGCRSIADVGNTNVNPIISFDDFECFNPQIMTVTRSVNGIVKSHSSGADVRLFYTPYVAL